jgi:nitroreductase/Pyruvate/2-oxoacid:ferredoxin oxidoreductase delta subunit
MPAHNGHATGRAALARHRKHTMGLDIAESAVPTIDEQTCTVCGLCVEICSGQVLKLQDGQVRVGESWLAGCIGCGNCMMVCPTESISVRGRAMEPEDRVELPPPQQRATADALAALLLSRRSIRRYKSQPVERELLERIVEMTSMAPMAIPPHEVGVVVFDGHEKVQGFAEDVCVSWRKSGWFLHPITLTLMRPILGKAQHRMLRDFVKPLVRLILDMRAAGTDVLFYSAPAAMLFHYSPWADVADSYIATTYAMLAAESLGLGSCMIGTTVELYRDKQLMAKYGVPPGHKTGLTLVLGYPDMPFLRGVRRRLASVKYA